MNATMKWTKVDDGKAILVFACPVCGGAEVMPPDDLVTTGTPVCTDCDCDMDFTHTCIAAPATVNDLRRYGDVEEDNDGRLVIYTEYRRTAGGGLEAME